MSGDVIAYDKEVYAACATAGFDGDIFGALYAGRLRRALRRKLLLLANVTRRTLLPPSAIAPRMLTKAQAAQYCGFSPATFTSLCPLPPVSFGGDKRLNRWDIRDLDEWLDVVKGHKAPSERLPTVADMRGKGNVGLGDEYWLRKADRELSPQRDTLASLRQKHRREVEAQKVGFISIIDAAKRLKHNRAAVMRLVRLGILLDTREIESLVWISIASIEAHELNLRTKE